MNIQISQDSQSAKLSKCAAQRRYRKKEEQSFLQLRQALKEVSQDDPRSKQEILKRASCELRRLADENILLLRQKAFIEACRELCRNEHVREIPVDLDEPQWWLDDITGEMGDTHPRHRELAAAIPPDVSMFTAPSGLPRQSDTQHEFGDFLARLHHVPY